MNLLIAIKKFERYAFITWDLRSILIGFYVTFEDGSQDYVYCGQYIHGKVSASQVLQLQGKIWAAKALLGEEEWCRLKHKHGVDRQNFLVFEDWI